MPLPENEQCLMIFLREHSGRDVRPSTFRVPRGRALCVLLLQLSRCSSWPGAVPALWPRQALRPRQHSGCAGSSLSPPTLSWNEGGRSPRFIRCRCTPCTDTEVGAQRPHPLPRCVSECYTLAHLIPRYPPHVHTGTWGTLETFTPAVRANKVCTARRAKRNTQLSWRPRSPPPRRTRRSRPWAWT